MSRDQAPDEERIEGIEQLVAWFDGGSKGDAVLGVGTEHEKLGFDAATLRPLAYEGTGGIGALLDALVERYGWEPGRDRNGAITALFRDGAVVTLEPGGQLELSGRITRTIFETQSELDSHLREVADVGATLGQRWTHLGLNPWDAPDSIPWMPKSRYQVMRDYLGKRGTMGHWMMKATCTVQANFDYRDEGDAMRKLALTSRLSPLVTALFATTPVREGRARGFASSRMEIWENTDPDRTGTPDTYLDLGAGFAGIVEWALDVPMLFVVRDGVYVDVSGTTFRRFLAGDVPALVPTMGDWNLHVSTLFPDVRLKRYIEVRTADAGRPAQLLALPALWKGVLYDETATRAAESLLHLEVGALRAFAATAARSGLADPRVRELARELVAIAAAGLDRQAGDGPSERVFLAPLLDGAGEPVDQAEAMRRLWESTGGDRTAVLEAWALRAG